VHPTTPKHRIFPAALPAGMARQPDFFNYVSAASDPRVKRSQIPSVATATDARGKTLRSRVFAILAPSVNNSSLLLTCQNCNRMSNHDFRRPPRQNLSSFWRFTPRVFLVFGARH
jgi:hypothetical protein